MAYTQPAPLDPNTKGIFPQPEKPAFTKEQLDKHWQGFEAEYRNKDGDQDFERFCHLVRRWGWCLPAPYGEPGISLYEYFKQVVALCLCEKSSPRLLLVGGDTGGIQRWIYTIQSRKAAPTLRGRSFYLQLITDGLTRRLLAEFKLPRTNLIYQGGGNFSLLLPAEYDGRPGTAILKDLKKRINQNLWDEHKGGLSLALAWTEVEITEKGPDSVAAFKALNDALVRAKLTRFQEIGPALFEPGVWEEMPADPDKRLEKLDEANKPYYELAREMNATDKATKEGWLHVREMEKGEDKKPLKEDDWAGRLLRVTKHRYSFTGNYKPGAGYNYAINRTGGVFDKAGAGFIFIGNVIPRVSKAEAARYQERWNELSPAEKTDLRDPPETGQIRDYSMLAKSAHGLRRYGVLRMDVDRLGRIFGAGLPDRPAFLSKATLSGLLGLFFEGYINTICREIGSKDGEDEAIYILYSGGDDLFVVGAWDRLPTLAEKVRQDFGDYTRNRAVTISGGITVADSQSYPLYQAAQDAGKAEKAAKDWKRPGPDPGGQIDRDALTFLGTPIAWSEFGAAKAYFKSLVGLTERAKAGSDEEKAPRALLTNLLDLDRQALWRQTNRGFIRSTTRQLETGRWYWRAAYNLSRTLKRASKSVQTELKKVSDAALEPATLPLVGLAARWAHLYTRTAQDQED